MSILDRMKRSPAPQATASSGGISLEKRAPGLVDLHKKAGISLAKSNLTGVKASVYLVLDHSGSMRTYYRDGTVQRFTERVLAAAAHFDDDGSVPVLLFDTSDHPIRDVTVDDYQGAVERLHAAAGRMGTTNYAVAMRSVIAHYRASGAREPAFVVFETDGSPDNRREAEKVLCEASTLPIFWQFVGFGPDRFDFLRKLDDLAVPGKRVIDNAGFFEAGKDPDRMSPENLYDHLMDEFPAWLRAARQQGIVRS
ncbi:VWA domain-containing protein [Kocuria arenosa]|uniref:vWA domain-containing protein n=1 Tax=Kocuria arenosa TaxID=3071446 RepID=UPI0034D6DC21